MKSLSYLGSDHTGFGWEVKVHLEILICYLDGDIGFFCEPFSCIMLYRIIQAFGMLFVVATGELQKCAALM